MASSNSFRKYGGIHQSEKWSNIKTEHIVSNALSIDTTPTYIGNFDISGNTAISGNTTISRDVILSGNLSVAVDQYITGNLTVDGTTYLRNQFVNTNSYNTDGFIQAGEFIKSNAYVWAVQGFYLDNRDVFLIGNNTSLGLNVSTPAATFDICGNIPQTLNVYSTQNFTRNAIAQNVNHRGVSVAADSAKSAVEFYETSAVSTLGAWDTSFDAQISAETGGNLTIAAQKNTFFTSNITVNGNTSMTRPAHLWNEPVLIYDNVSGNFMADIYSTPTQTYGNSATLTTQGNNSHSFLNILSGNVVSGAITYKGLSVGGGTFPNDQSRSMGLLGWTDASGQYVPAEIIVSGNNALKNRSTVGFNTFSPITEQYVVDINGPVRIHNEQLNVAARANIEILKIGASTGFQTNAIACGSPYTFNLSGQNSRVYYTTDAGQSWKLSNLLQTNFLYYNTSVFSFDTYFSVMSNMNSTGLYPVGYLFYTVNGGADWTGFANPNISRVNGMYINATNVYFLNGTIASGSENPYYSLSYFPHNYNYPSITQGSTTAISLSGLSIGVSYTVSMCGETTGGTTYIHIGANQTIVRYDSITGTAVLKHTSPSSGMTYRGIHTKESLVVAVGVGIISYSNDYGNTYTDITTVNSATGFVLNSVFVFDSTTAIAVGNGGWFIYSIDGGASWNSIPTTLLVSSGASSLLNSTYNYTNVMMTDANTILLSYTKTAYDASNSVLGESNIVYCFLPSLFNSNNNIVMDICGNIHLSGGMIADNTVCFYGGVPSASPSTGSVLVAGGVGVSGNITVGGNVNTGNIQTYGNSDLYIGTAGGATKNIYISNTGDRVYVNGNLIVQGTAGISSTALCVIGNSISSTNQESTSSTTGQLVVFGGLGVSSNVFVGNQLNVGSLLQSTSSATGALVVGGGAGVGGNLFVGGNSTISGNNNITGALVVSGAGSIGGNLTVSGNNNITGALAVSGVGSIGGTTNSTGTTTGALTVVGGVGIGGNLFVGGNSTISGNNNITGALVVSGAGSIGGNLTVSGNNNITGALVVSGAGSIGGTTNSTGTTTGALTVVGGVGIGGNLFVGGNSTISGNNNITGALAVSGAGSIGGNLTVSGNNNITGALAVSGAGSIGGTTNSTGTTTGALTVVGGVGIGGNLFVGGNINFNSTTPSVSVSTGALVFSGSGGIGVGGNIYCNTAVYANTITPQSGTVLNLTGNVVIGSSYASTSYLTGALVVNGGVGIAGNINTNLNINAASFNATSDYRIKSNVSNLTVEYSVENLNPKKYYNQLLQKDEYGFVAHEVQDIYPTLVNGEKDGDKLQSLNYIGMIAILVNDIKLLKERVSALERENKRGAL